MFSMNRKIIVLAFAGCCMAAAPAVGDPLAQADARQQVLALEKEWTVAEDKHDAAMLRRILDDKFVAVGTKLHTKEEFISAETGGPVDPTQSQVLSDVTVIIDQDTAVTIGTDTAHGTKNGAPYTAVFRYVATYIRRHGHWTALAEHIVAVPAAK